MPCLRHPESIPARLGESDRPSALLPWVSQVAEPGTGVGHGLDDVAQEVKNACDLLGKRRVSISFDRGQLLNAGFDRDWQAILGRR